MSLPWPAFLLPFVKGCLPRACCSILGLQSSAYTKSVYRVGRSGWHAGATCAMGPWDTDDWSLKRRVAHAAGLPDPLAYSRFKDSKPRIFAFWLRAPAAFHAQPRKIQAHISLASPSLLPKLPRPTFHALRLLPKQEQKRRTDHPSAGDFNAVCDFFKFAADSR